MAALPLSFTYGKSTGAAKACLAACLGPTTAAASALLNEKNWRANYYRHFLEANARMLAAAPADCVRMCEAGLAAAREQFSVDGVTLGELERSWDRADPASPFGTRVVVGLGPPCSFTCPFDPGEAPQDLAATITTVEALVRKGAAEPSVVRSLRILSENAAWQSEANRENVFVVLGAGSQMGPARCLLSLGCTVIAVDLNGKPDVWNRLIAYAETTNGTLLIPVRKAREDAGCNVLTEFLDIALWILEVADRRTSGKRIVMATFLYADGAVFSRLAVAADAIARAVIAKRPDTALQSLCSPTECFSVPSEPPSGEWKDIRERGVLRSLSGRILPQGNNFRELLEAMVHPDPTMRPSAQEVADRARAYVGECDAAAAVASGVPSEQGRVAELDAKCDALGMELDAARREKVAMQERMQKMQVHYEGQMKALQGQMQQAQAQVRQAQVQVQQVQAQAQAQVQQVQAQAQAQAHAKPKKKKDRFGADRFGAFRKVKGGSSAATAPLMASRRGGVGSSSTSLASRLGAALEEDDIGGY